MASGVRWKGGLIALAIAATAVPVTAGCASSDAGDGALTVGAASSLRTALTGHGKAGATEPPPVRVSFAGSDLIASQIEQGAGIDVFAAASTIDPDDLYEGGLVEEPVPYAGNVVVIATPRDSGIDSINDLAEPGLSLVVGDRSVPVGVYTREILNGLPVAERESIAGNIKSEEPDVASIMAKLVQGAADAGFVYATDVTSVPGEIRAVEVPAALQPEVVYSAAVVKDTDQPEAARRYISGLLSGSGARALKEAGFLPPP